MTMEMEFPDLVQLTRRDFLTTTAGGLGAAALASLFKADGLLAEEAPVRVADPLQPKAPHFAPKAKACIFVFMEGAPSQMDLFDPKPKLNELDGRLPESHHSALRLYSKGFCRDPGQPRKFEKHGQCGMDFPTAALGLRR